MAYGTEPVGAFATTEIGYTDASVLCTGDEDLIGECELANFGEECNAVAGVQCEISKLRLISIDLGYGRNA